MDGIMFEIILMLGVWVVASMCLIRQCLGK